MPSYINTNISALNAQNNLNKSQTALSTSLQRLSSGLRINSAKDDAAGMAIVSRMSAQINGNAQAARNANDGISLSQTAEGDMAQIGTNLQRMRDLAVQSANATNSSSDRAALNSEVQALAAEIDRVAQNSSFNGVKLLDGSFTAQNFQVGAGATAADQVSISSIASARTNILGGTSATSSATLTSGAITGGLAAGSLTLNGQQVGASTSGSAPGQSGDSGYQIAAAINLVSAQSGVTAVANAHSVSGGAPTATPAGVAANTFQINGIWVGAVAGSATAPGQGANLAAAINLVSTQTGVVASANAASGAVTLTAADGRDISFNATAAGKAAFLTTSGFTATNVGTTGATSTAAITVAGSVVSGTTTTASTAALTIDGIAFYSNTIAAGATGTLVTGAALDTAWAAFAAANSGYSLTGSLAAGGTINKADGGSITLAATVTAGAGGAVTALTGFVAGVTAGAGIDNHGTVTLSSTSSSGIVVSGGNPALAGFTAGTTAAASSSFTSIASVDVTTATSALNSLTAIDGAITTINTSRAALGAYQNRFASIVSSLQTTTENLTASRSRIQDTDFAAETSSLTRAQILQQAGTAMLAQANQLPNTVLALLK
jgi:flagellin